GVVISAGLAAKTVKVQIGGEEWNKKVKKYFKKPESHLVHDPNNSVRTGDVVEIVSGWRSSKRKRFVVNRIIAPFGPPVEERPPVPTQQEREAAHAVKRGKKLERK
ncbi:nucleic acid-binding protein, partial [Cryphonectria parasitica EP155]